MRNGIGVLALQGDFEAHCLALGRCGIEAREVRLPGELGGLRGLVVPGGESTTLLRLMREYGFDEAIPRFVEDGGALYGTCAGAILVARSVTSPAQWSLGLVDIEIERNGYGRQVDSFETELTDVAAEVLDQAEEGSARPARAAGVSRFARRSVSSPPLLPHEEHGARSGSDTLAQAAAGAPCGTRFPAATAEAVAAAVAADRAFDGYAPPPADQRAGKGLPRAPLPAVFIRAPRILHAGPQVRILAAFGAEPVLVRQGAVLVSTFHPELTPDRRVHRYFIEAVVGIPSGDPPPVERLKAKRRDEGLPMSHQGVVRT